jgi:hypothetical protein
MKLGGAGGNLSWPLQFHLQSQCMEGEGRSARRWCGWQRQKALETREFWTAVDIQPEVLTLFDAPQTHKPHEPIDTLTDLPKWEVKGQESWWLQPSLAAAGFTAKQALIPFFSPMCLASVLARDKGS